MQFNITLKDSGRVIAAAEVYIRDPAKPSQYLVKAITYGNKLKGFKVQTYEFEMTNPDVISTGPWQLIDLISSEIAKHEAERTSETDSA